MQHFTPISSLIGGMLIGLSAALLWLCDGRIAGISGILGGIVGTPFRTISWRLAFLAGLVIAPALYGTMVAQVTITIDRGATALVVAGLLVGFGTRLGGGCTSGHGVCGMARLSLRSVVATGLFMTAAAGTTFLARHVIGG